MFSAAKTLSVFGLVAIAQAHIIMTFPPPFVFEDLSNKQAPLNGDGSNFPCKLPGGTYNPGPEGITEMPIGSTQALAFIGSAVHGGGSCQVSITYDQKPTKNSVWKVIHSIEGGCPMRNIDGNNGNDALKPVPDTYSFKIPSALPAGQAVLAWTWFNKVGNREMYMNCAPIKITGNGASSTSSYNQLPALYMANVGNGCETPANTNLQFPNPGSSLEINNNLANPFKGDAKCEQFGGNAAPAPAPVPSQAPPSSSAAAPTPKPSATKASIPGGVFVTVDPARTIVPSKSSTTLATVVTPTNPANSAPAKATTLTVIPTKATATAKPPAATGGGNSGVQSGPCTQEGRWNCIGGSSFQQCASGSWSTPQSLAAGTKCTAGQSDAIDITAIGARSPDNSSSQQPASKPKSKPKTKKRVIRVSKKHLHRHQARHS